MSVPDRHPAPAFDVFNVRFECVYDPTMHVLFGFDGRLHATRLAAATRRVIAADPYLHSRYVEDDEGAFWERLTDEAAAERAFVCVETGDGDEGKLPPHVPPASLDVREGPQLRVTLYRREGAGDRVAVTCHHGFCDARGLKELARLVIATYNRLEDDPAHRPPQRGWYDRGTGGILARFSDEQIRTALALEEPFVDRWRFPCEHTGRGRPRIAYRTLPAARLGTIKAFGRAHGATVNDVLIGAFFLALLAVRNDPSDAGAERSILTSADARRHLDDPGAYPVANLSVAYEITLSADPETRLDDLIGQVAAVTARQKADGLGLGCILFYEEIFAAGMPAVTAFFDGMVGRYDTTAQKNPVFSNTGIIGEEGIVPLRGEEGQTLDLTRACYLPTVCRPYGSLLTASTYRDRITIMSGYEEGPYATDTVERFLDIVEGFLP
jgi:NRPS condensation-like uncharacterized protein